MCTREEVWDYYFVVDFCRCPAVIYIDHEHFCTVMLYQKFSSHSTVINSWYNFLHMTEENYIVFIGTNVFFCYSGYLVPTIFQMSLNMPNVFILVESSTFLLSLYFSREVFIANLICLESEYLYPGTCIMVHVLLMKCILKFGVSNINIHNST